MFQSTVNITLALGVVGEVFDNGPIRALPWNLESDPQLNVVGRAFTVLDGGDPTPVNSGVTSSANAGVARAGGTGIFAGILINPKEYASFGTVGNPLGATLTLPDFTVGTLLTMGEIVVTLPNAVNVGDKVFYDNTTGVLGAQAASSSFTGVVATNTLTVTAFVAGGAPLAIGTVIKGTGVTPGTVITALGTGTGGNGTYTVTGAAAVGSTTMTGDSVAPAGKTMVPNCVVDRFDTTGSGLAVIKLTN